MSGKGDVICEQNVEAIIRLFYLLKDYLYQNKLYFTGLSLIWAGGGGIQQNFAPKHHVKAENNTVKSGVPPTGTSVR